jgi:hypothetical protein
MGRVVAANFTTQTAEAHVPITVIKNAEPAFIPPVVTYEPKPLYTNDAQREHVQGEVTIRVTFKADGTIQVVHLISGLPAGLMRKR